MRNRVFFVFTPHYSNQWDAHPSLFLKGHMSAKRMISDTVCGMDSFVEMPLSAQALYFHLVLQADSKGFFSSAVKTMRMIGAKQEDLECLINNGFILRFPGTTTCCIRHWNMMNTLKSTQSKSDFQEAKLVRLDGGVYVLRTENDRRNYDEEDYK